MVETNELDALATFAESVWLVECKDSRFGQNDLYVTAIKAEAVGADHVVVLTTNDIHENVQQAANQIRESGRRRRSGFKFLSAQGAADLRSQFEEVLMEAQANHIRGWLAPSTEWFPGSHS